MPTEQGHGQPAHPAEPRRAHRASRRRHAVAAAIGGRQHRLQRARPGRRAGARDRLCRAACTCARRSIAWPRVSRWSSSTCPNGLRRRKNFCRSSACKAPSWPARRRGAPAHAAGRHERGADPARRSTGSTQPRITLTAPIGGVVAELMVREGMTVMPGATIVRISGLSTVWANADVPESQRRCCARVPGGSAQPGGAGHDVRRQGAGDPARGGRGDPHAEGARGTRQPGGALVPGMFVTMHFMDRAPQKSLMVPTEAVIQTGKRTVVMLAEDNGTFGRSMSRAGIESAGRRKSSAACRRAKGWSFRRSS